MSSINICQSMAAAFNDAASSRPKGASPNLKFRYELIREEVMETIDAILKQDEVKIIDGLCDVLYVSYGAAHVCGLSLDTKIHDRQAETNKVDWQFIFNSADILRWQLHWIQVDIANNDMTAMEKDLKELAVECWELGYRGLGLDLFPFYEEVHRTNMLKLGGPKREDGKQLKPEGWQPPRIKDMLIEIRAQLSSIDQNC